MNKELTISTQPSIFKIERKDYVVPYGLTYKEILTIIQPNELLNRHSNIYVNGIQLEDNYWYLKPDCTDKIEIRVIPAGGGDDDPKQGLRIFAMIAVIAASAGIGALVTGGAGVIAGVVVQSTLSIGGMLAVYALIPPPTPDFQSYSGISPPGKRPTLSGSQNQANPWGVIPCALGNNRMTPLLGADTYTELSGDDQYIRMLFIWGYGPVQISDIKIGETPIIEFEGVTIQTLSGYTNDSPIEIYTNDIHQENLSINLYDSSAGSSDNPIIFIDSYFAKYYTRRTTNEIDEIEAIITFPKGLGVLNMRTGDVLEKAIWIEGTVTNVSTGQSFLWSHEITEKIVTNFSRAIRFVLSDYSTIDTQGQYDIKMRSRSKNITYGDDYQAYSDCHWTALKSISYTKPINHPNLATTAIRIKATNQLSGTIDTLNGIVQTIAPIWDGSDWNTTETTNNPAALFRRVLQGNGIGTAITDSRLNLTSLESWYDSCESTGRKFNLVIDNKKSIREVLTMIAAAGRAALIVTGNSQWGVIQDDIQTEPKQHFTPRNCKDFKGSKAFLDLPHALKVAFTNEKKGYQQDEMIIYDDGYSLSNATIYERLDMIGITDPDQIWKMARYHIATARLRPEIYTFKTDIEHIVCTRGDLIRVAHDVPLWGLSTGRVKSLYINGSNIETVTIDEICTMETGKSYSLRFRLDTGVSLLKSVITSVGDQLTLSFTTPFLTTEGLKVGDLFMYGEQDLESVELKVKSIEHSSNLEAKITCVDYAPEIMQADSGIIPLFDSKISLDIPKQYLRTIKPIISRINSDESVGIFTINNSFIAQIVITLSHKGYQLSQYKLFAIETQYKLSSALRWKIDIVDYPNNHITLTNLETLKTYDIRVRYHDSKGIYSDWFSINNYKVIGFSTLPPDISIIDIKDNSLIWSHDYVKDIVGYKLRINSGYNTQWSIGYPVHDGLLSKSEYDLSLIPTGIQTFMIKCVDSSGYESENHKSFSYDIGNIIIENQGEIIDLAALDFPGKIYNFTKRNSMLEARPLDLLRTRDDTVSIWSRDDTFLWGDRYWPVVYEFEVTPTQEQTKSRLSLLHNITGDYIIDYVIENTIPLWSKDNTKTYGTGKFGVGPYGTSKSKTPLWNSDDSQPLWQSFPVDTTTKSHVFALWKYPRGYGVGTYGVGTYGTSTNPLWNSDDSQPLWQSFPVDYTIFAPLNNLERKTYKIRISINGGKTQGKIKSLSYQFDYPNIIDYVNDFSIDSSGSRLPVSNSLTTIKSVNISIINDGGSAMSSQVYEKDSDLGPLIKLYDKDGMLTTGVIDASIIGY